MPQKRNGQTPLPLRRLFQAEHIQRAYPSGLLSQEINSYKCTPLMLKFCHKSFSSIYLMKKLRNSNIKRNNE